MKMGSTQDDGRHRGHPAGGRDRRGAFAAGGIVAWEYTNSNEFCANMCHSVHPEETVAHAASPRAGAVR